MYRIIEHYYGFYIVKANDTLLHFIQGQQQGRADDLKSR